LYTIEANYIDRHEASRASLGQQSYLSGL